MTSASSRLRICFILLSAVLLTGALPGWGEGDRPAPPDPSAAVVAEITPVGVAAAEYDAAAAPGGLVTPPLCPPGTMVAMASEPICPPEWNRRSQFALYGWLSGINADLTAGSVTRPVEVSFSEILSHLDMTFMGYYETAKGKTGLFLDAIYVRLSGDQSFPDATLDWQVTQWLIEAGFLFYGGRPERGLDGLVGARYLSLSNDLILSPLEISRSTTSSTLMPIIGGRYRTVISATWSGTLEGDIGGYGGDASWQALATLRYRLSENTSVGLGYRYLPLDFGDGNFGFDGAMSGPLVGVAWDW